MHDPSPDLNKTIFIASGVLGDGKIKASETGLIIIELTFNNIKFKRADKVVPLLEMSSIIKVHEEKDPLDPVSLFQRMSITADVDVDYSLLELQLKKYVLLETRKRST